MDDMRVMSGPESPVPPALHADQNDSAHRNYHLNHCFDDDLMIKALSGIERICSFWTGKRKYKCRACGFSFRAPDRRRTPREVPAGVSVTSYFA
jgi:hypothetical protein